MKGAMKRVSRWALVVAFAVVPVTLAASSGVVLTGCGGGKGSAVPLEITSFDSLGTKPRSITVGPDGALWFTNEGSDTIGRITTEGRTSRGYGAPRGGVAAMVGSWAFEKNGCGIC
jgi:streptogramin lyase